MYRRSPGLIPSCDVAGDGLNPDSAAAGGANLDVARHRRHVEPGRGVVDRQVAGDEICRQLAAAAPNPHVTRGGSHLDPAVDVTRAHVAARGVDGERARGVERDVAGGGLDLDRAERAPRLEVGGVGAEVDVGARGTAHLDADPRAAADDEARLPLQLDDHLVAAAAIGHLDPGLLDRLPRDVVVAQRHELDLDARRVDGLDADLAAAERHAQRDLAGRLEDGHADPSGRAGCGRRTTRTPSGRWRGGRELSTSGRSTLPKNE